MDNMEFYGKVAELIASGKRLSVATVVKTVGSTSGKVGSKAIILEDGSTLLGWVGGGCVESTVLHEALKSIKDGRPRTVVLEMEDELRGTGVPCGGTMEVYIEPVLPKQRLVVIGHGPIVSALAKIGKTLNMHVVVADPESATTESPDVDELILDPDLKGLTIDSSTAVVVCTMHKQDHKYLKVAVDGRAWYVALVASKKRTGIVLETLAKMGVPASELARVRSPAGVDIGAETPEEIALSIMAELVALKRGGSGGFLKETKEMKAELADVISASDLNSDDRVNPVC